MCYKCRLLVNTIYGWHLSDPTGRATSDSYPLWSLGRRKKKGIYTNEKWVPKRVLFGNPWVIQNLKKSAQKTQTPYSLHDFFFILLFFLLDQQVFEQFYHFKQTCLENSFQSFNITTHIFQFPSWFWSNPESQKANQLKSYSLWLGPHLYLQISMEIKSIISAKSEHQLLGTKVKQHNQGILFHLTLWN